MRFRCCLPAVYFLVALDCCAIRATASAVLPTSWQHIKLTADDGAPGDEFGVPVALDGSYAVVGARLADDAGESSGSAYVFDVATGQKLYELHAMDAAVGDWFGISVAVSQSTVVVGAYADDDRGSQSGSTYLFNATTGAQIRKLVADDGSAGDGFGIAVAIDGNLTVIGAYEDGLTGSAYVFNASTGQQVAKLLPTGLGAQYFGGAVAISGTRAIVGANSSDVNGIANVGSAYIYDLSSSDTIQLHPSNPRSALQFGNAVDIDGDLAIVGAVDGTAYVFNSVSGQELYKLTVPGLQSGNLRIISVAMDAGIIAVGAPAYGGFAQPSEAVFLFRALSGEYLGKVTPFDGVPSVQFGASVDLSDGVAIIGAPQSGDHGLVTGAAYFARIPEPTSFGLIIATAAPLAFSCVRKRFAVGFVSI